MSEGAEDLWKEWLLEIVWQEQKHHEQILDHPPARKELRDSLLSELVRLKAQPSMAASSEMFAKLEEASVAYVLEALMGAAWKFEIGKHFSTSRMASKLGVIDQHHRLLDRLLEILSQEGFLKSVDGGWKVVEEPATPDLAEYERALSHPGMEAETGLLRNCGPELARVLRGECSPLELLFPEGDIALSADFYCHAAVPRMMNDLIGEVVRFALARFPADRTFRILEVGAGTGSATSRILPLLAGRQTEYVFTDISRFFFRKARERFQGCSRLNCRVLDIEQDPQSQGFEPESYDLVVAANVLHATRDLRGSLEHVRRLLSPGGRLVLLEITGPVHWMDLVFGLLEGWWLFADHDLRPSHATMPAERWMTLLHENGFEHPLVVSSNDRPRHSPACREGKLLPLSVITARKMIAPEQIHPRGKKWLILADGQGVGQELKQCLCSRNDQCILALAGEAYEKTSPREFRIDPAESQHYQRLLEDCPAPLHGVVHLWSLDSPPLPIVCDPSFADSTDVIDTALSLGCRSTLHLTQALYDVCLDPPSLWLVTRGAQAVQPKCSVPAAAQSALWGMGKVIGLEHPELNCTRIDLDPDMNDDVIGTAEQLLGEISRRESGENQIAFRGAKRYVARILPLRSTPVEKQRSSLPPGVAFSSNASYLITGGLGGLGLLVAGWMVERGARRLILTGRSRPGPEALCRLKELEQAGARVTVTQTDVSDADQVDKLLKEIGQALPPLRGIFHAAGVLDDSILINLNWERFLRVLDPKVKGAWNLHTATVSRNIALDYFVLFSSAASMVGNAGQSNHAAANGFLDGLACHRRARGLAGLSINWGAWYGTGALAEDKSSGKRLKQMGMGRIDPSNGLMALNFLLTQPLAGAGVIPMDRARFIERLRLKEVPFFTELVQRTEMEDHSR
jgi:NAD(P)-dependent dehydrogenase (short-subunit alcohol dehydrogenase family)/SAM-dependent methyltransferase